MRKAVDEMATELEVGEIHTKGEEWGGQPGGHTGWTDEGVVFIELSPADDLRPVLEHIGPQLAPSG